MRWPLVVVAGGMVCSAIGQRLPAYEEAPIFYSKTATSNVADVVGMRLKEGKIVGTDRKDLLRSFLKEFNIPEESQVLVFSKTSLQLDRISPTQPRAIYFNEDTYLGFVQGEGGLFELAVTDPNLGIVFYAVDPGRRTVQRDQDCLSCHGGSRTHDWPGVFVRSIFPDSTGNRIGSTSSYVIQHDSLLEQRWGGWYVTGKHGRGRHMGNVVAKREGRDYVMDTEAGANLTDLSEFFDTSPYLRPDSDIIALMVVEHQCEMHNRLSRGALRTRKWARYQKTLDELVERDSGGEPGGTLKIVLDAETERIVEYLLFCNEERLPPEGISGTGDFEKAFRRNRKMDSEGRSLKDFELRRRLFQYRCSYMIYSQAFDNMPDLLKRAVYRRVFEVLEDPPEKYDHLRPNERRVIKEILLATKPEIKELGIGVVGEP